MSNQLKPKKKVTFLDDHPACMGISDNESTCAVVGSDNEPDKAISAVARIKKKDNYEEEMPACNSTDDASDTDLEWTRAHDGLICVLKSQGNSWAEIGKVVKRSRRECQRRHRELSAHAKGLGFTTDKLAKLYINDYDAMAQPKAKKGSKTTNKSKDNNEENDENSASKGKGKSKEDTSKPAKSESATTSKSKKRKVTVTFASSSSDSSDSCSEATDDEAQEYYESRRYQADTVYAQMYPDQKTLKPDRFYSESDCRVLAGLEARYRANKWLHIQADFCNATGRMVEAEILKAKFDEE
ncbi:hypothetical protein F5B22DRAFT_647737 [Xylaria bambusicola]|uniref:uncharacterized protein n=1 Tax=Xylaria bambusicola TaxID=326684 RepID=UPI002007BB31|nr:uncharacterized protein F5B22DRAFT_647737 [Xylaria bambusicola]KAI0514425.1 hypothetical protein F5B22DRAFT_647737 [Xylaria bambusicola]